MKKYLFLMLAIIGMAVSLTSCSSDDDNDSTFTLNKQSVELIARTGVAQLEASISDVEWSSENPYVAVVSPAGRVTAIHVGETNIIARSGSGYKTCKVVVTPKYNTYVEPITEFGKSKDYIIKKLGVPSQETSNTLAYGESDDYQVTFYTFENDKLKTCGIALRTTDKTLDVPIFLLERYEILPELNDGKAVYFNASKPKDATVMILLDSKPYAGHIWVYYTENTNNK